MQFKQKSYDDVRSDSDNLYTMLHIYPQACN